MPSGGRRPGAGRKPGPKSGVILGLDGARQRFRGPELPPAVSVEEHQDLLVAPASLSVASQVVWVAWAGYAVRERTLTPATAAGFGQLCEQWAYLSAVAAQIDKIGAGTHEAVPYLATYIRLGQRVDASLARFKLTAFGKPATSDKPKAAANPWGALGSGQVQK